VAPAKAVRAIVPHLRPDKKLLVAIIIEKTNVIGIGAQTFSRTTRQCARPSHFQVLDDFIDFDDRFIALPEFVQTRLEPGAAPHGEAAHHS
jgi:hypothetical protein